MGPQGPKREFTLPKTTPLFFATPHLCLTLGPYLSTSSGDSLGINTTRETTIIHEPNEKAMNDETHSSSRSGRIKNNFKGLRLKLPERCVRFTAM